MSKKKTLILEVSQSSFLDWFYSDLGTSGLRELAYDVIETLQSTGEFKLTVDGVFDNCGYIPFSIIDFPSEEIEEEFREAFEDEEIEGGCYEINGRPFQLKLV